MKNMFESDICYPSDQYGGRYVEFEGQVINVDNLKVDVLTSKRGVLSGYVDDFYEERLASLPHIGDIAVIRCYDWGGGWYPDDRIVRWIRKPLERIFHENN